MTERLRVKSVKETQKWKEDSLGKKTELKSQADKVVEVDFAESIRDRQKMCEEMEVLSEQKKLQEEEFWRCLEKH